MAPPSLVSIADEVALAIDGQVIDYLLGGRTSTSYAVRDGQLLQINFDEGHTEEHPCSEDTLREAIALQPKSFREWLAARKA